MVFTKKLAFPVFFTLAFMFCKTSFAQRDFILLKKHNKTILRIFPGDNFSFTTNSGVYKEGLITKISNDSIFIKQFVIRKIPTTIGTYILDTAGSIKSSYNYNDIKLIGEKQKGFNFVAGGNTFIGGSILLVLGSGVVYLVDRNKFSPQLLIGSAILGGAGYLLTKIGSKGIVIGKRGYRLQYMSM